MGIACSTEGAGAVLATAAENADLVRNNMAKLYVLEQAVLYNRFMVGQGRSMVEENRALAIKNLSAAFTGNHRMCNLNTDKIFQNREMVLAARKPLDGVQDDFILSMINQARIDRFEHGSALNRKMGESNRMMSEVNSKLIQLNRKIMEGNAEIVGSNTKHLLVNASLRHEHAKQVAMATRQSNTTRINSNIARMGELLKRVSEDTARIQNMLSETSITRQNILADAKSIRDRRDEINANHTNMRANVKSLTTIMADSGKTDEHSSSSSISSVARDTREINTNKAKLYELQDAVMHNKFLVAEERSMIEENRELILKNYTAAFMGNCQIASNNTEKILQDREVILKKVEVRSQIQANHVNSMLNESKIDYLEHRANLDSRFAEVSNQMDRVNAELKVANQTIMDANAEIVNFNGQQIITNSQLLSAGGLHLQAATPESNGRVIQKNSERIKSLASKIAENSMMIESRVEKVKSNREAIMKNTHEIYQRRKDIELNLEKTTEDANTTVGSIFR